MHVSKSAPPHATATSSSPFVSVLTAGLSTYIPTKLSLNSHHSFDLIHSFIVSSLSFEGPKLIYVRLMLSLSSSGWTLRLYYRLHDQCTRAITSAFRPEGFKPEHAVVVRMVKLRKGVSLATNIHFPPRLRMRTRPST